MSRWYVPRRRALVAAAVTSAVLVTVAPVQAALTAAAPSEQTWEKGRVVTHSDGDTPYVDVWGDGTKAKKSVRLIDVNATEVAHRVNGVLTGRNWCHGKSAERRAWTLMPKGSVVRLRSQRKNNQADFRNRLGRTVLVRGADGKWRNPQEIMLREGHVMWFPHVTEWVHNADYHLLSEEAARAGKRMWNPTRCGTGPQQAAQLRVWVHYDANGADDQDNAHRNDEYVVIRNEGGAGTLKLGRWHVRDTALWMYDLPASTTLPVGDELRVHTGKGRNTARNVYMGLTRSIFGERESPARGFGLSHHLGDGAFLLDPQGDFRAWSTYPCILDCSDPTGGDLDIAEVGYDFRGGDAGREYVVLHNTGENTLSLAHLQLRSWPWNYVFPTSSTLAPGASVTVHITATNQHPANTATDLYWFPSTTAILNDDTDEVDVSTLDDVLVACETWNNGSGASATCAH